MLDAIPRETTHAQTHTYHICRRRPLQAPAANTSAAGSAAASPSGLRRRKNPNTPLRMTVIEHRKRRRMALPAAAPERGVVVDHHRISRSRPHLVTRSRRRESDRTDFEGYRLRLNAAAVGRMSLFAFRGGTTR